MGLLLGLSFLVLVFLGMPIGLSIGVSSLIFLLAADLPFEMLPQMMFTGSSSFVLVAVPYFILAGDILAKGGISERIVAFAESSVGRLRGGLSIVSVIASMFIAAVSGSGAATTWSISASAALTPTARLRSTNSVTALSARSATSICRVRTCPRALPPAPPTPSWTNA